MAPVPDWLGAITVAYLRAASCPREVTDIKRFHLATVVDSIPETAAPAWHEFKFAARDWLAGGAYDAAILRGKCDAIFKRALDAPSGGWPLNMGHDRFADRADLQ